MYFIKKFLHSVFNIFFNNNFKNPDHLKTKLDDKTYELIKKVYIEHRIYTSAFFYNNIEIKNVKDYKTISSDSRYLIQLYNNANSKELMNLKIWDLFHRTARWIFLNKLKFNKKFRQFTINVDDHGKRKIYWIHSNFDDPFNRQLFFISCGVQSQGISTKMIPNLYDIYFIVKRE